MIELALLDETLPKVRFIKTGRSCMCLLDTGANICVWTRGQGEFDKIFPAADKQIGKTATVSGFGGNGVKADVYLVDRIDFRSGRDVLSLRDLHIAVTVNTRIGAELVLAMTTLRKNIYTFDMVSNKFKVEGKTDSILCDNDYVDGDLKRTIAIALSQDENTNWDSLSKEEKLDSVYKDIKFNKTLAHTILPTLAYKTRESLIENINKYYSNLDEGGWKTE